MDKYTKGDGSKSANGDIPFVHPTNIGKGIKWNESSKQYEVNIGDGLEINKKGQVVVKNIFKDLTTEKVVDNGTGEVIGEKYTIDYGNGLIETNGLITFPLDTTPRKAGQSILHRDLGNGFRGGCTATSMQYTDVPNLYHKESAISLKASDFGMSKFLYVNGIALDLGGARTETAWVVSDGIFSETVAIGVHTLAGLEQDKIKVMFQVKGIKAQQSLTY